MKMKGRHSALTRRHGESDDLLYQAGFMGSSIGAPFNGQLARQEILGEHCIS